MSSVEHTIPRTTFFMGKERVHDQVICYHRLNIRLNLWNCFCTDYASRKRTIWVGSDIWCAPGISAKYFLDESSAIDGAIAWDLSGDNDFHIHADYLYHNYSLITVEKGELPAYFGIGSRLKIREHKDDEFGIRFPVGLAYAFADVSIDVFAEVAPILDVVKDTEFDLEGGIGARFYF